MWHGAVTGSWYGQWFGPTEPEDGWVHYPTGGLVLAGLAASSFTAIVLPEGGLVLGGTAPESHVYVEAPAGGITFGGQAIVSWSDGGAGGASATAAQFRVVRSRNSVR